MLRIEKWVEYRLCKCIIKFLVEAGYYKISLITFLARLVIFLARYINDTLEDFLVLIFKENMSKMYLPILIIIVVRGGQCIYFILDTINIIIITIYYIFDT